MLTTDTDTWQQGCVDVERNSARKVLYNARGVVSLRCNLNLRHYRKTHFVPVDGRLTEMLSPKHKVCFTIDKYYRG